LPDWWAGDPSPLAYLTFGSVTGSMPIAADVYRIALGAMSGQPVRVLLTVGTRTDIAELGPIPGTSMLSPGYRRMTCSPKLLW